VAGIAAAALSAGIAGGGAVWSAAAADPPTLVLDKSDYQDKLTAMWVAQNVAGAAKTSGSVAGIQAANVNLTVEYLYLLAMTEEAGTVKLTGKDIAKAFNSHVNAASEVWFSTKAADLLMEAGAVPPNTSAASVNPYRAVVDPLITVESLGALAPGRPDVALDIAQLPIRTTGGGYGASAGQFEVLLYSLTPAIPETLTSGADRVNWLLTTTLKYLPAEGIIRTGVAKAIEIFQANPDWTATQIKTEWRTYFPNTGTPPAGGHLRDERSTIELTASHAIALLVGAGDFSDTWTALKAVTTTNLYLFPDDFSRTLAGQFGLMLGTEALQAEFVEAGIGGQFSTLYKVNNMQNVPDYLPADANATDSFPGIAARSVPLIEQTTIAGGGTVSEDAFTIALADPPADSQPRTIASVNPDYGIYWTSANAQARTAGTPPTVTSNLTGSTSLYTAKALTDWRPIVTSANYYRPNPRPSATLDVVADGLEGDESGVNETASTASGATAPTPVGSFFVGGGASNAWVTIDHGVALTNAWGVRWYTGDTDIKGGAVRDAIVEVDPGDGNFVETAGAWSEPFSPSQPFQQADFVFDSPRTVKAIRVTFHPYGDHVNIAEIDTLINAADAEPTYPELSSPALDLSTLLQSVEGASWLQSVNYTAETWQTLADAVAQANGLLAQAAADPASITQDAAGSAASAIGAAIANLVPLPDPLIASAREALERVVGAAKAVPREGLTAASWAGLQLAITAAGAALNDPDATATALREAAAALSLAGTHLRAEPPSREAQSVQVPGPPVVVVDQPTAPSIVPEGSSVEPPGSSGVTTVQGPRIKLAQASVRLAKGQKATIPVSAYSADSKALKVTYGSSAKKVATVSTKGVIKAVGAGNAVITVKAGSDRATLNVTVVAKKNAVKVKSVAVSGVPTTLKVGDVAYAEPTVKPATAVRSLVTYTSSASAVVAVDKSGRLKALTPGTATITVKAGAKTKKVSVTVK
jgi:hypothetical protein